jgi:hypothetical protein
MLLKNGLFKIKFCLNYQDLMETCCIHPIYFVTDLRLLKKREKRKKNVAIAGCKTGSTVKKPSKINLQN